MHVIEPRSTLPAYAFGNPANAGCPKPLTLKAAAIGLEPFGVYKARKRYPNGPDAEIRGGSGLGDMEQREGKGP